MSNFSWKLDFLKLKNAFVKKMRARNGSMIDVLIIPIEMNNLYVGQKSIYLDGQGIEMKNPPADSKDTHLLKQSLPKAIYDTMTDEQKKAMPILGNALFWNQAPASTPSIASPGAAPDNSYTPGSGGSRVPDEDDLPF